MNAFMHDDNVCILATYPFDHENPIYRVLRKPINIKLQLADTLGYKPGVKTIQFYVKFCSNPSKTYGNTIEASRNTSLAVEA